MRTLGFLTMLALAGSLAACGGGDDDDNRSADAAPGPVCGDNACSGTETCDSCSVDCGVCPPNCGDGSCNGSENCVSCAVDCGQCPPGCGDNSCGGSETCDSCPADCGVCTCTPGDPTGCSGEEICIIDTCLAAFGRTYTISVFNLTIKTTNPVGESWDAVGGAPDPYVVIALSDSTILTTVEVQDTFDPIFADSVEVVIPAGAKFRFDAWDGDIASDDWIIGCEIDPLTADWLRIQGPVCEGTVATGTDGTVLDILIVPKN